MTVTALDALHAALVRSCGLLALLRAVRGLSLRDAYVAAGAVRDTYWLQRHGRSEELAQHDVDVVFFDPSLSPAVDGELVRALSAAVPGIQWDVTNQAHVHTWYPRLAGVTILPLSSTVAGIGMWPELATCVGARLAHDDTLEIVAPYGVDDLVALRLRPNLHCPDRQAFARRVREKRLAERFPQVRIERG